MRPNRSLGVCYYPEHWPEDMWAIDAAKMVETGISVVRIGEFAWSRIEPRPNEFEWGWLDRAVETLSAAGLEIVMGTPTATPPKWMVDKYPDMLAIDAEGRPRKFGSRRHYCFSHQGYRDEAVRIARLMGERYGTHDRIVAWQIDNEYACHETTRSYSKAATEAFRNWLAQKYQSPTALNQAWGNVFWSMEVSEFDEVDLPNLTVTEPNPAHVLDFYRFASDEVVTFNKAQVDALRRLTKADLLHNYMGKVVEFDHWDVGNDLDIATWDSYPIGFLSDRLEFPDEYKAKYLRQGDPDMQAFHHDLYRAVGKGRWWVMEQQPGPVNWAPWNPAPQPGMMRLWAWEAFAHGAEVVAYFRWRQAPFAQEQMHAGLMRPDNEPAPALAEAATVADELKALPDVAHTQAQTAIVFDYPSCWAWEAQPQGKDFSGFELCFAAYRALRRAGLNVDFLPPDSSDLSGYRLVLAPGLLSLSKPLSHALLSFDGVFLMGPRSDLKTPHLSIPSPMGPNVAGLDVTSALNESLPPSEMIALSRGGSFIRWFEHLEGSAPVLEKTTDGRPAVMGTDHLRYLAGWPDDTGFDQVIAASARDAGLTITPMPEGLRQRHAGPTRFLINYGAQPVEFDGRKIPGAGVVWDTP